LSTCWFALASGAARAKPVDSEEQTAVGPVIALVFDPGRREAEATVRAIESHLSGTGVVVVEERVAQTGDLLVWLDAAQERARSRNALGVFAIDSQAGAEVRVFFSEPDGEATLIRRIRRKPTSARVGLEEAAIVVRSIVEALRDGGHVGMVEPRRDEDAEPTEPTEPIAPARAREPSTRPNPKLPRDPAMKISLKKVEVDDDLADEGVTDEVDAPPAPGPRRRGSSRLSVGISAVGTSWAVGEGWQFGPALGLQLRVTSALRAELEYSWFSDLRVERENATFALTRHPLAASLTYAPFRGLSPIFQTGAFVDVVSRRTESAAGTLRGTGDDDRWTWGFGGRVGVTATPVHFLHARLLGGLELPTSKLDYVVDGDESRTTLLSMRSVRPHLQASIQAEVW
jgi:hypothetical protein